MPQGQRAQAQVLHTSSLYRRLLDEGQSALQLRGI